jgi:hypothetical protein
MISLIVIVVEPVERWQRREEKGGDCIIDNGGDAILRVILALPHGEQGDRTKECASFLVTVGRRRKA